MEEAVICLQLPSQIHGIAVDLEYGCYYMANEFLGSKYVANLELPKVISRQSVQILLGACPLGLHQIPALNPLRGSL